MSFENFLDHKCDIYHVIKKENSPGYGLPTTTEFEYGDTPNISGQCCHFNVKSGGITIVQGEPQTEASGRVKLNLPPGTDIRLNDRVISHESGLSYRAELPRNIRGHHIMVYVNREDGIKGAL